MDKLLFRVFLIIFTFISFIIAGTLGIVDWQIDQNFNDYLWKNYKQSTTTMPGDFKTKNAAVGLDGKTVTVDVTIPESILKNAPPVEERRMGPPPRMGDNERHFAIEVKTYLYKLAAVMFAFGAFISYLLSRYIVTPIVALNQTVKAISRGKLDAKVAIKRTDEIGQLAASISRMTDTLKHNEKSRQEYLAAIAHELRTPLTILKANLEGMEDGIIDSTPEQIASLLEEVNRLSGLVDHLKTMTLIEAGQIQPDLVDVSLKDTINSLVSKMDAVAREKGLTLGVNYTSEDIPPIKADAAMIEHCIYNLLVNAVRYTEKGSITVDLSRDRDHIFIKVIDTGIGIHKESQEFIFESFYRADKSRSKKSGGTGLGLAIVKNIIALHQGTISVDSELGKGSTFTIALPIHLNTSKI